MLKSLDIWLPAYFRRARSAPKPGEIRHVLLCVCDHFEPFHLAQKNEALDRVNRWRIQFPKVTASFSDTDGVQPKHTFFYPIEQYDADVME